MVVKNDDISSLLSISVNRSRRLEIAFLLVYADKFENH